MNGVSPQRPPVISGRRFVSSSAIALGLALCACGGNASAPQDESSAVVIAAVELQFEDPSPGGQSVWLANRGTSEQDISCWGIRANSSGVTMFVNTGTRLAVGRALRFATAVRMLASPEIVTLTDRTGQVVARTPELKDSASDDQLWYLMPGQSWVFGRSRLPEAATDGRLVPAC
jgi:hypothetical protein